MEFLPCFCCVNIATSLLFFLHSNQLCLPNHSVIATDVTSLVPQEEVIYNPQEIKSYSLKPTNEISFTKALQVIAMGQFQIHLGKTYSNYQQINETRLITMR